MITKELENFLRNYEIKSICDICKDIGFYIQIGESVPKNNSCLRNEEDHKYECIEHSGFRMKPKSDWYKFKIANMNIAKWGRYQTHIYKNGEFIELKQIKELI